MHACHLLTHSASGDNSSTNALLLRSDIHDLFDAGLIGINPRTLRVAVKKSLANKEYLELDGIKLSERTDGVKPDGGALKERWRFYIDKGLVLKMEL